MHFDVSLLRGIILGAKAPRWNASATLAYNTNQKPLEPPRDPERSAAAASEKIVNFLTMSWD